MLGSSVLDVAIGLIFVFLLLSLICSAANELIEMVLKKRAKDLEKGIAELIGDPTKTTAFLKAIYDHGLVNGLFRGEYKPGSRKLPSYIPAQNFALAVMQVKEQWTAVPETGGVATLLPANIKTAFDALEKTAGGDAKKLQDSIEAWYNSAMDRVSGWYKRRSQAFILVMGLAIAYLVNADCIQIVQRLSSDTSLRQGVVALAQAAAKDPQSGTKPVDVIKDDIRTLDALGLPVGWSNNARPPLTLQHVLGWILTALAVSLGAPFWFDMLNKIMVVRSTVKPDEKSGKEGSKDKKK
jgi:hypothetical protein